MPFDVVPVEPLTDVRAVELVRDALVAQRRRSQDENICLYRGPGEDRCAIGHLLPDWLYEPSMEGVRIEALMGANADIAAHFRGCSLSTLRALQRVHDHVHPLDWHEKFSELWWIVSRGNAA